MTNLDLTDIDPLNWERAQARARAVQAYLALPKRNGVERDRFAADLGISPNLFSRLVAAWKAGRGVDGLMVGRPGRRESQRLPARAREIVQGAIALHGSNAPLKEIKAAVLAQCAKEKVPPPSKGTIHDNLMRARGESRATQVQPSIVVGELLVNLPCDIDSGEVDRPKLLVAVEVASRHIVAFRVVAGAAQPDYPGLVGEVRSDQPTLPIVVDEVYQHDVASTWGTSLRLVFESRASIRRQLIQTFGSKLNGLQLIYRHSAAAPVDSLLARKNGRTIDFGMAVEALKLAVRRHNSRWSLAHGTALAA